MIYKFLKDNLLDFTLNNNYFLEMKVSPYFITLENKSKSNDVLKIKRYENDLLSKIEVFGVDYNIKEFIYNDFKLEGYWFILYFQKKIKQFCEGICHV